MTEEWRSIVGYEGYYSVSSLGRVRRDTTGRILKPGLSSWGRDYRLFRASVDNKARSLQVHIEVAKAFLGPRPAGLVVNHKNGNKQDNRPENLEYVTKLGNELHAAENGLKAWGMRHGMRKVNEDAVREIRAFPRGARGFVDRLMAKYGVSRGCISAIRQGKTWRHLT